MDGADARTYQIHSPSNQMVSHTRTILTPTASDQNHRMLLHIMSLSGDITRHHPPRAQPHSCRFPFCRIGFLGLGKADFEADPFQFRGVDIAERGGDGFPRALSYTAALFHYQYIHFACEL